MWSALFELAVVLLAAWFVWRLIVLRLKLPGQPAEPGQNRDDYSGVPSRLRPRPKSGAGAVALAEPDEDDEDLAGPVSTQRRKDRGPMQAAGGS